MIDDDDDFIKTGKYKQKARVKRDAQSSSGSKSPTDC